MTREKGPGKNKTEKKTNETEIREKETPEEEIREEEELEAKRRGLVSSLAYLGIAEEVLNALLLVPRHEFVPARLKSVAYVDTPLEIGCGQTISAPHMVAIMCDLLELAEGQKVLEIGAGSGYNAAVMGKLIGKNGHVYTVERLEALAEFAKTNLKKTGSENVTVLLEDGSLGYSDFAPYDRISVTCTAPEIPEPLLEQLKPGGLMVIPVGEYFQELVLIKKDKNGEIFREVKGRVVFVPLIGRYGFRDR
ncbi:MAG: protein-L-isoaspartate O-methyltransferase [Methanosarcinaceae archaeon]|nr:protein-L-isoaspartate O-methyltransferase [Methanosarcinaceae archaeon]MDD4496591.1 protein-L-isoaspartate O-methyltransferase [Methanosarcinaceae archaeon]